MSLSDSYNKNKKFITAAVYGFCGGVKAAVSDFESACRKYGGTIYVLHELIHNNVVTRSMVDKGAVFVENITDVPDNAVVMIGAHGVSFKVEQALYKRCTVIKSTCPRVKALQDFASQVSKNEEMIFLCKAEHPEAISVLGCAGTENIYPISNAAEANLLPELKNPVLLSQTTLSHGLVTEVECVLKKRFPNLRFPGNICDSSFRRQKAAENLAEICDYVLVVGSSHSSNAAELVNVVKLCGTPACLIEDHTFIDYELLKRFSTIGITAGASTPDESVSGLKRRLLEAGYCDGGKMES